MRRWIVVTSALLGVFVATRAESQRLLSVGLGGGVSLPQGDLRDAATTGWNALATLVLSTPMQPLGLRADVAYNQFSLDEATTGAVLGASGHENIGSATLNATYRLPTPGSPASPYLIAGLGAYRTDCSVRAACAADTRFGWNVGLSTKLYVLGFRSFLEARYHRAKANGASVNYFPVTLGLMF